MPTSMSVTCASLIRSQRQVLRAVYRYQPRLLYNQGSLLLNFGQPLKSLRLTTGFLIMIAAVCVNAQAKTLILKHVNVIPMDKQQVLNDHRVVVVDDKVSLIEPASNKLKVTIDEIIDSRGHYMIPGLSDTHFHQSS